MKNILIIVSIIILVAIIAGAFLWISRGDDESLGDSENNVEPQIAEDEQSLADSEQASEPQPAEDEQSSGGSEGAFDPKSLENELSSFVLRDEDLPDDYRLPPGGENIVTTMTLINEMGELQAKRYVLATGRVNGWRIQLERERKDAFAPSYFESSIELFESVDGAKLALSPEWFPAYQDGEPDWVDGGCDLGDECLFYYSEKHDPAQGLTTLRYQVAFVYRNVLVWVMGRGLDIDVTPEYILNAAQAIFDKLEEYAQLQ